MSLQVSLGLNIRFDTSICSKKEDYYNYKVPAEKKHRVWQMKMILVESNS